MRLLGLSNEEVEKRLQKEARSRKRAWSRQRQFFQLSDSIYYFERHGKKNPGNISGSDGIEVQTNDGTNVVDLTVGLLTETEVDITAVPVSPEAEGQRESSELEAWLWGVLDVNCEDQGRGPHVDALNDATRLGMGVLYTYFDEDRPCPFVIKSIDPYTVYPEEGANPKGAWRSVIVIERKPVTQLEEEWGKRIPEATGQVYEQRERVEIDEIDYWGHEFVDEELAAELQEQMGPPELAVPSLGLPELAPPSPELAAPGMGSPELAALPPGMPGAELTAPAPEQQYAVPPTGIPGETQGEQFQIQPGWYVVNCVLTGKHLVRPPTIMFGYEEIPFTIFGCKQGSGRAMGQKRPEYYFLSALFPIHKAILLLDANMSAQQKQVALYVNLPAVHKGGRMGRTDAQFDAKLGDIIKLQYPDEEFGFPRWQGNPPDVFATQAFHKKQIQEGSFSSVAMGEQMQLSGFAMSQLWQANLVRLAQPRRSWGHALKDMFRKIQSYAINFTPEEPIVLLCNYKKILSKIVQMTGIELAPFIVDVKLSTDLPQDKYRRYQIGIALAQLGPACPFSLRTLSELFFDIQQPEEEEMLKIQEMIRGNVVVEALMIQKAWEAWTGQYIDIDLLLNRETAQPFREALKQMPPQAMPTQQQGVTQQPPPPQGGRVGPPPQRGGPPVPGGRGYGQRQPVQQGAPPGVR